MGRICTDGYCINKLQHIVIPGLDVPGGDEGHGGGEGGDKLVVGPCNSVEVIKSVQRQIGVNDDGAWGPKSQKALDDKGGDFKAFAGGCSGSVPHWTQGTGVHTVACTNEGKACGKTGECCGSLICEAGACVANRSTKASGGSSTAWWALGIAALGAIGIAVAYSTGTIGPKSRQNPAQTNTRYKVVKLQANDKHTVQGHYLDPVEAGRVARAVRNQPNSQGAVVVREVWFEGKWHQG
jgi:hypothetical protein